MGIFTTQEIVQAIQSEKVWPHVKLLVREAGPAREETAVRLGKALGAELDFTGGDWGDYDEYLGDLIADDLDPAEILEGAYSLDAVIASLESYVQSLPVLSPRELAAQRLADADAEDADRAYDRRAD
jgi:hypothetical protein